MPQVAFFSKTIFNYQNHQEPKIRAKVQLGRLKINKIYQMLKKVKMRNNKPILVLLKINLQISKYHQKTL